MAKNSDHPGNDAESHHRSSFSPERPHFFQIILSEADKNHRLRIPEEFVARYRNHLSNAVLLKMPSGAVWRIGLTDSCGEVWMESGWRKFTNYYSIRYGHFLVFRYDGNSVFYVMILDNENALEIEYPIVERSSERNDIIMIDDHDESMDFHHCRSSSIEEDMNQEHYEEDTLAAEVQQQSKTTRSTTIDNMTALGRAEAFKSPYPMFIVAMKPSYLNYRGLHVPVGFAKKYFSKPALIILSVSDGRTWSLNCSGNDHLSIRWSPFAQDNNLKLGDVCAFELIERGCRPKLKVTVFREEDLDQDNKEECTGGTTSFRKSEINTSETIEIAEGNEEKVEAFKKASAFKSNYPFTAMLIRKSYMSELYLPARFTKEHFRTKPKTAILCKSDKRTWKVKWFCRSDREKQGFVWGSFTKDNNLKEGDACVFELIKNCLEPLLKVTIFRKFEDHYIYTNMELCTALERAKAFKPNHPSVIIKVKQSYLYGNCGLCMPRKFSREYLNRHVKMVRLMVRECSKKWDVSCSQLSTREGVFYLNWRQFAKDNNLEIEDVCVFTVIDKIKPIWEVVVFRAAGGDEN
ncbi:B3 domain-containing transcription factor VRN1-like [Impatiens glandulifera]|uniref:B3 domain-containing transcription factor VRN1-like n=1 Tax=Impatiens glandulifera TaxID=253017 RepID=UPI001FB0DEAB|nr:B3 domain-containing transcription factor VRN1-like [Impatiens glandulifera]